ncbi:MAG: hypothetical protein DSZ12_03800, partial [Sulfurovum sp.]
TWTVSLASLVGTDDQNITDFSLSGGILTLTLENGNTKTVDLSDFNQTIPVQALQVALAAHITADKDTNASNELLQSAELNGTTLKLTDAGGTTSIDLSTLKETSTTLSKASGDKLNYEYTNEEGNKTTFRSSPIVAFGKANASGSLIRGYGASVTKNSTGIYTVTLDQARSSSDYTVQLTLKDAAGAGNDDYDISYNNQTANSFKVYIGDNDNGGGDRTPRDLDFMFTVMDY